jgi:hypothetical protein
MAQRFGSSFERVEVVHNARTCAIRRAAEAMLEHGVNIVAVTDRGVPGRPVRPIRMTTPLGRVSRAARTGSSMLLSTWGWCWPDTEKAHGSPPDWCQVTARMMFGFTVRVQ